MQSQSAATTAKTTGGCPDVNLSSQGITHLTGGGKETDSPALQWAEDPNVRTS